jgi:NADPH:quinone reductase-like Zn-dependent oxidoreductase
MKAIVCTRYGPPETLQFAEVAKPIPKDDEVLIKIRAASVNPVDRLFRAPYFLRILTGLRRPKNPRVGCDMAGQVEAVEAGLGGDVPEPAEVGVGLERRQRDEEFRRDPVGVLP